MRFVIDDLPPRLQAQVRAQLALATPQDPIQSTPTTGGRKNLAPNKTELAYQRTYLTGLDARYEALTFRMSNGHRYTPDWVVFGSAGDLISCHEVKGAYALHSHQRARLAFDQCAREFPGIAWTWAVKTKSGWEVSHA